MQPSKAAQIAHETQATQTLSALRGPLTAREALNAILPAVRDIDQEFKLTRIGSQEGITPEGGSYGWDFFFEFPRRRGFGDFDVHLCPGDEDDEGPWCLDMRVRPLRPSEAAAPALPLEFRDSAQAVHALTAQGVDFIAGDSHMTLSTKALPNGRLVWHTISWDKPYDTPFA